MIVLRSGEEIKSMRKAGKILADTMERLKKAAKPGVKTIELDSIAREEILNKGAYPAFKGYKGYPGNICTSINEVVVHGIPSSRKLKEGDILSIDVGVKLRDYFADAAITIGIGQINPDARKLIDTAREALYLGIKNCIEGKRISDISNSIQKYTEREGFSVVRAFVGHGIGTRIHEEPEIPNYGRPGTGPRIENGMVLAIEPMINAGTYDVEILEDGWTAVTKDRRLSAHFEHTVAVGPGGPVILTEN